MQASRIATFIALIVTLVHVAMRFPAAPDTFIAIRNALWWQVATAAVFSALATLFWVSLGKRTWTLAIAPALMVALELSAWLVARNYHHTLGAELKLTVFGLAWILPALLAWLFVRKKPALRFMPGVQLALFIGAVTTGIMTLDRKEQHDDRPDLALVVLDALQVRALGHMGAPLDPSPYIDALATRGWTSDAAFSSATTSVPGHAAILFGLDVAEHGARTNDFDLPDTLPASLAERLRDRGYTTMGFCHNPLVSTKAGFARGFDIWWNWGEHSWLDSPASLLLMRWPAVYLGMRASNQDMVTAHAKIATPLARGPLFTFVQLLYTHDSYVDGDGWVNAERTEHLRALIDSGEISNRTGYSDEEIAGLHASYLASVKYSDRLLGELLDQLSRQAGDRGLVVVVTSDHGENLAEHGDAAVAKHFGSWSTSLRIPLVVSDTRVKTPGVRDSRLVSHQRVPRLLLDAADLRLPLEPEAWASAVGRALQLDPAFIYSEPWLVTVDDSLKVAIDRSDLAARPIVNRWREDFEDQAPLADPELARERWEDLLARHQEMLEAGIFEPPAVIDPEKLEHLRALGYVE
jgi:hypothetical protein